jgi:hypothetical protein
MKPPQSAPPLVSSKPQFIIRQPAPDTQISRPNQVRRAANRDRAHNLSVANLFHEEPEIPVPTDLIMLRFFLGEA